MEISNDLNKDALEALDRIEKAYTNSNKFILNSNDTYEERGFKLQGFERVSSDAKIIRAALLNQSNSTTLEKNK